MPGCCTGRVTWGSAGAGADDGCAAVGWPAVTSPATGVPRSEARICSSRFWPADLWQPGRAQASFDKQFVRDWLTSSASGWDRASDSPPPSLPADVVERTQARYLDAYERLTGTSLSV